MAKINGSNFNDVILPLGSTYNGKGAGFWLGGTFIPWPANVSTARADEIEGGRGADYIDAGAGDDSVDGGDGADILIGGSGNDKLKGGDGEDPLTGGLNSDELTGGKGADTFVYTSIDDSRATASGQFDPRSKASDLVAGDTITDFVGGVDKIDVAAIALAEVSLPAGFELQWKGSSPLTADRTYGIWYEKTATFTDVKADTNGDGIADLAIRLTGSKTLNASDFIGVNSAPDITGGVTGGTVIEAGLNSSQIPVGTPTATGTLIKTDPDSDDTTSNDTWSLIAGLGQSANSADSVKSTYGTLSIDQSGKWTYELDNVTANGLALNETKTETFTVKVADAHGGFDTQEVTLTVTGSNDAPTIASLDPTALPEPTDDQPLTATINVAFTDVDLTDVGHTASITGVTATGTTDGLSLTEEERRALISIGAVSKDSGSTSGSVSLSFSAAATAFAYLNDGEELTLTYTVKVDDGDGGSAEQEFVITVTGSSEQLGVVAIGTDADGTYVSNTLQGSELIDQLTGGNALNGGTIENYLYGYGANDTLTGGNVLNGGERAYNEFHAGAGTDTLTGGNADGGNVDNYFYLDGLTSADQLTAGTATNGGRVYNVLIWEGTSGDDALTMTTFGWTLSATPVLAITGTFFVYSFLGAGNDVIDASQSGTPKLYILTSDGNDTVLGANTLGSDANNRVYAGTGADTLTGGNADGGLIVYNDLYGEADDDTLTGGDALNGSTAYNSLYAGTGADTLTGGNADGGIVYNYLYGEADDNTLTGGTALNGGFALNYLSAGTGADTLTGGNADGVVNVQNYFVLDDLTSAYRVTAGTATNGGSVYNSLQTSGTSGDDELTITTSGWTLGGTLLDITGTFKGVTFNSGAGNDVIDASQSGMTNVQIQGGDGNDTVLGADALFGPYVYNRLSAGYYGVDTLIGGNNAGGGIVYNILGGLADADTLTGGDNSGGGSVSNDLYGDFEYNYAMGSGDTLTGGDNSGSGSVSSNLYGDAVYNYVQGGDDLLIGGDNTGTGYLTNALRGDGYNSSKQGGNDRLVSGQNATDYMWGDADQMYGLGGNDTFVFAGSFGNDVVYDFRSGEDTLEFDVDSFADLSFSVVGSDTLITTTGGTVTLAGYMAEPSESDFLFV